MNPASRVTSFYQCIDRTIANLNLRLERRLEKELGPWSHPKRQRKTMLGSFFFQKKKILQGEPENPKAKRKTKTWVSYLSNEPRPQAIPKKSLSNRLTYASHIGRFICATCERKPLQVHLCNKEREGATWQAY